MSEAICIDLDLPRDEDEEAALLAAAGGDLLKLFALNSWRRSGLGCREDEDWLNV